MVLKNNLRTCWDWNYTNYDLFFSMINNMIRIFKLQVNSNFSEGLAEFHLYKFSGDIQNFEK